MKNLMFLFVCVACLLTNAAACTTSDNPQPDQTITVWDRYNVGSVLFEDKAPETAGSDIYRRIIPQPESYIKEQARTVLATLYTSPKDSIPRVYQIHYTLEDIEGVSAKSGGNGYVSIFYSTRHIEQSFGQNDTAKVLFETRGVLLHELTTPTSWSRREWAATETARRSAPSSRAWQTPCG